MKTLLLIFSLLTTTLPFELGVNRPNLFTYKEVARDEMSTLRNQYAKIDEIYDSGCREVRLTMWDFMYTKRVCKHILYANDKGMNVTVNFLALNVYPEGTERVGISKPRPKGGWPTHEMDLGIVRKEMRKTLSVWRKAGCRIDAIEVGNEMGWCHFNGDFPIMPRGEGLAYDSSYTWQTLPENVPQGIRKIAEATRIIHRIVGWKWLFSKNRPKVIVGGLNYHHDLSWCKAVGGTIMRPELVLQIYKGTLPGQPRCSNVLKHVDGVGIHMYPHISLDDDYETKYAGCMDCIKMMMEPVKAETDLPMYVTEVGFRCGGEEKEDARLEAFDALLQAYADTDELYDWRLVQIYSWDALDNYTFIREDGSMMPSAAVFARYSTDNNL